MPLGFGQSILGAPPAAAATDYTIPTSAFSNDGNTIALYHLDNSDNDSSSNGYNFTTSGGFSSSTKQFGTHSGDLTQTGDFFQYSTSGNYGPHDGTNPRDYTLECFVNYSNFTGAAQSTFLSNLMQPAGDQAGNSYIWFGLGTDGKLKMFHFNVVSATGTTVFNTGQFYHIALTYDTSDNKYRGYANGFKEFETAAVTLTSGNTPAFKMTFGLANAGDTNGFIDEIRISDTVRYSA